MKQTRYPKWQKSPAAATDTQCVNMLVSLLPDTRMQQNQLKQIPPHIIITFEFDKVEYL
jgi:hypothetical protein